MKISLLFLKIWPSWFQLTCENIVFVWLHCQAFFAKAEKSHQNLLGLKGDFSWGVLNDVLLTDSLFNSFCPMNIFGLFENKVSIFFVHLMFLHEHIIMLAYKHSRFWFIIIGSFLNLNSWPLELRQIFLQLFEPNKISLLPL